VSGWQTFDDPICLHVEEITLELGRVRGLIVFDDADLEKVSAGMYNGTSAESDVDQLAVVANKFRTAGQVCMCANPVFVQRGVLDKVVALVREQTKKLYLDTD
jgi:succinate-semialdehyde dehydrogenase/glutarate-semialdehyde dehydrogenase